ncbi:hypothetical protein P691DRAFT_779801 [Macrolepiota fuliginosa MF-IS2]|uniref:BTB domain-containing protein n=1 Tax=Macrolepiota fuliginosa MF-IS2 TaxID=1400762 RepID=A0A9P5WYX8_9AGAR|nr:hypothetical protein P691DRAFT_779801 [Macrolepiota fuliginosa MF-IS2]
MITTLSSALSTLSMVGNNGSKVHSVLNHANADVVLSSTEGTQFRMHNFTLKTTSGYFRSTLSNAHQTSESALFTCTLPFSDAPLERVLLMISGLPTTPWSSFTELEDAVTVMEYLDTPGPLSLIQASFLPPVLLQSPIAVYGLAAKLGWDKVLQHAAELSLPMGNLVQRALSDPEIEQQLKKVESAALMRLLAFHQRRRDEFRTLLYSDAFAGGNAKVGYCTRCNAIKDNSPWRDLRSRLLTEMERDTSGKWFGGREMQGWDETRGCWDAKCPNIGCRTVNYSQQMTMENLREGVKGLPMIV